MGIEHFFGFHPQLQAYIACSEPPCRELEPLVQIPLPAPNLRFRILLCASHYQFASDEPVQEYGKWKTRLLTRLDSVLETNELFILDSYKEEDDPNIRIPAHIRQEID
jgi:hypothetical protein